MSMHLHVELIYFYKRVVNIEDMVDYFRIFFDGVKTILHKFRSKTGLSDRKKGNKMKLRKI